MRTTLGNRESWGKALFVLLLTLAVSPAWAAIWYVAPNGTGGGTSWQDAGPLQATVNAAASGDEVWVAAGTYTAATDPVLTMKAGVALYAGFSGTETERDQRDWTANVTTIDGEDTRRCVKGHNNSVLDGFVITRGKSSAYGGGGMYNYYSSPTVTNCTFTDNTASEDGGGMNNRYSSPTVTNCTFTGNTANADGGGMHNVESSPIVMNCTFTRNTANNNGGGLFNWIGSPKVINCIIWDNFAGGHPEMYGTATVSYSCIRGGYSGTGNISVDPLLLTSPCITKLRSQSPCIDVGTSIGAPLTDIEGTPRPQGAGVDMGAYEGGVAEEDVVILSINTSPDDLGISIPPAGLYEYERGDMARVSVRNMGGLFQQWTGDVSGNAPEISFIMDADKNVTAVFNDNVYYVNASSTAVAPDGRSWETAYVTLQEAVEMAGQDGGGSVWAAAGVYTSAATNVLHMKKGVFVFGGFNGKETEVEQRDWENNLTVIDGELTRQCIHGADLTRLDGLHIVNGYAYQGSASGGGIFNQYNAVMITNCVLKGNKADYDGGGMYNYRSSPTVTNCTFTGNTAGRGGGMYNSGSSPTITNCTFLGNNADSGGGIYNRSCSPTVTNCTFKRNTASYGGGGMYHYASSLAVTNSIFNGNTDSYNGGGIYCASGSSYGPDYSLTLMNSVFTGNSTTQSGGGIYTEYHSYNSKSSLLVTNCTFAGNIAKKSGGGIESSLRTVLTNCILWDNRAASAPEISGANTVSYSCIQGGYSGTGNINVDPLLLTSPGIPKLRRQSPCIDAGTMVGAPSVDILGTPRPQGAGVDMGAYEGAVSEEEIVTLTINTEPTDVGITIPPAGLYFFESGDRAEIIAHGIGVGLSHWTGDVTGTTAEISFIMDADKSVTAMFADNIFYANASSTASNPDGRSWDSAYATLQEAVDSTYNDGGGEVWVCGGRYTGLSSNAVMNMRAGVFLYGGFSGVETTRDQRDWTANVTTIDGENRRRCVNGADNVVLDGFVITHGRSDFGGGMANMEVSPTVSNCNFVSNWAEAGGGMYNKLNAVTILDTFFLNNRAISGGGIYNDTCGTTISECTFSSNTAEGYWDEFDNGVGWSCWPIPGHGGGIFNKGGISYITNTLFIYNICTIRQSQFCSGPTIGEGSAIYGMQSNITLANCTLTQNGHGYTVNDGYYSDSNIRLLNCIVWENLSSMYIQGTVSYSCIQGGYAGVGNISVDPLLASDYRLQAGSPCIDAGTSEGAPVTDMEGTPRPQGAGWDMGAYEFVFFPLQVTLAGEEELLLACDAPYAEAGLASVVDARDGEVVDLVDPALIPVSIWRAAELIYTSSLLYIEADFNHPDVIARPVAPAQEMYTLTYNIRSTSGGFGTATRMVRLECAFVEEGESEEGETPEEGEPTGEGELPEGEVEIEGEGEGEVIEEGEAPEEGEGETLPEGEGEMSIEGEGETSAEGEGETPDEGEGETPVEGEGETPDEVVVFNGDFELGDADWEQVGDCVDIPVIVNTAVLGADPGWLARFTRCDEKETEQEISLLQSFTLDPALSFTVDFTLFALIGKEAASDADQFTLYVDDILMDSWTAEELAVAEKDVRMSALVRGLTGLDHVLRFTALIQPGSTTAFYLDDITTTIITQETEGEGEAPAEGEGEAPAEGEVSDEGEGEAPAEGETPTEGEGEAPAEGETPTEGEMPAEGEGEAPDEGEGETPTEGEGETPLEGEGEIPAEGETPTEGEGETPAEGEGETPAEGEGEEPTEGEGEPDDAPACGCSGCGGMEKMLDAPKRFLGDWLLLGLVLLASRQWSMRG